MNQQIKDPLRSNAVRHPKCGHLALVGVKHCAEGCATRKESSMESANETADEKAPPGYQVFCDGASDPHIIYEDAIRTENTTSGYHRLNGWCTVCKKEVLDIGKQLPNEDARRILESQIGRRAL